MRRGSTHAPSSEGPKGYHSLIVGLDREPDRCCTSRAVKRPPGRRSAISGVRASTAATSPRQRTASVGLDHWHCGTGIWRSSKNVNNLIEQDTRGVKQRIAAMLGFKGLSNAAITIGLSAPAALLLEPSKKLACKLRHSFENTGSHMTPRWRRQSGANRSMSPGSRDDLLTQAAKPKSYWINSLARKQRIPRQLNSQLIFHITEFSIHIRVNCSLSDKPNLGAR